MHSFFISWESSVRIWLVIAAYVACLLTPSIDSPLSRRSFQRASENLPFQGNFSGIPNDVKWPQVKDDICWQYDWVIVHGIQGDNKVVWRENKRNLWKYTCASNDGNGTGIYFTSERNLCSPYSLTVRIAEGYDCVSLCEKYKEKEDEKWEHL